MKIKRFVKAYYSWRKWALLGAKQLKLKDYEIYILKGKLSKMRARYDSSITHNVILAQEIDSLYITLNERIIELDSSCKTPPNEL
jgi:hypothetical protein